MPVYRLKPGQKHYLRSKGTTLYEVKPGEKVNLTKDQFQAVRDKFEFISNTEEEKAVLQEGQQKTEAATPILQELEDGSFNVLDPRTKLPINDEPISKEEAEELSKAYDPDGA